MDGHKPESNFREGVALPSIHAPSPEDFPASRRGFIRVGLGMGLSAGLTTMLSGCAASPTTRTTALPGPVWKPRDLPPDPATTVPLPSPPGGPPNVLARSRWSGGDPVPSMMDRMTKVTWITVHHDGMEPFYATDEGSSKARLESIRRAHRAKGWGDIGYHYVVDRNGRACKGLQPGQHRRDVHGELRSPDSQPGAIGGDEQARHVVDDQLPRAVLETSHTPGMAQRGHRVSGREPAALHGRDAKESADRAGVTPAERSLFTNAFDCRRPRIRCVGVAHW